MWNVVAAALVAAIVHAVAWGAARERIAPPDVGSALASVSYSPFTRNQDPTAGARPSMAVVARDLDLLAGVARGIRLYTATGGVERIPAMAAERGLAVSIGAWIDRDEKRNAREIRGAIDIARANRNVRSVIVGNETILREEKSVDEMIALLRQVKKRVRVPVSTGEVWHVWLDNPELVKEVDFIAVHILPYWEGVSPEAALDYTFHRVDQLREAYPGKRIVVAEFGWPSRGYNNKDARPDPLTQASVIRRFLFEAEREGITYNIVEAFDQPWKTFEGSVGPYWGLFDADRRTKFPFDGTVKRGGVRAMTGAALALGLLLTGVGLLRRRPRLGHAIVYAFAANAMGAGIVAAALFPFQNYLNVGGAVMWTVGFLLMLPLAAMTLAKVHEIGEVLLGPGPRRLLDPERLRALPGARPMVSIHIPAYREPAAMVIETLNGVAALDYPDFEAVVVINNTPEEHYWKPVEERCKALGPRFKFVNVPSLAGFKAGALNEAMRHADPRAEVIGVIDADYVVRPDWLRDLIPAFADPQVALVQAPQDHRDGGRSLLKAMMNAEYAGFFDVGMVRRNEDDAIIQHGTMCLVRRHALEAVGGWATDTIVEDTDLGLRLFEAGWRAHYTNRRYGHGLVPDTYKAFKTQRERWAYGSIQLLRKHWPHMRPGTRGLTAAQKFQFLTGWVSWLSDGVGAMAAVMNLLWVPAILFIGVLIPTVALTVPVLAAFMVNVLHCVLLYGRRVSTVPFRHVPGVALAAMSLQLTVARAVVTGFVTDKLPFKRTDKGGNAKRKKGDRPALAETVLGLLLTVASAALVATNETRITEINVFAAVLAIQSVPFLAASLIRVIEVAEARFGSLRRRVAAPASTSAAGARIDVAA